MVSFLEFQFSEHLFCLPLQEAQWKQVNMTGGGGGGGGSDRSFKWIRGHTPTEKRQN